MAKLEETEKVKTRRWELAQMKGNLCYDGFRNMSSSLTSGSVKDVLPLIVSNLGIVSTKSLLCTCWTLYGVMDDDEFWRQMLIVRFEMTPSEVKEIVNPQVKYLQSYYRDHKRADEAGLDYKEWCPPYLTNYYLALSKEKLPVCLPKPTLGQAVSSELLGWGFWHSNEDRLVEILDAVDPRNFIWAMEWVYGYLTLPAERRKVARAALIRHFDLVPDASFDCKLSDKAVGKTYDHLEGLILDCYMRLPMGARYTIVSEWLKMLEIQGRLEESGGKMIVRCTVTPIGMGIFC